MAIDPINNGVDFTTQFMIFTRLKQNPKTERFLVTTKDGNGLGIIKWKSTWRRYCFFPDPRTDYDAKCHRDLAEFLDILMDDRKKRRK